ncbi:MFS multidrug transporter [Colletotrichum kahawae]|uniref:MFS multidrug transporter n=1 Tax=Colletotrichum kahawae TaxID=34407 RepID=A0AAD9YL96_COLKA|nr:MFS multidrug transporter [Colletotrichum kahawae]
MSALLCCESLKSYKALRTDHEVKFTQFMAWAKTCKSTVIEETSKIDGSNRIPLYAIQLVRQVNFGPLESKRYFVSFDDCTNAYVEVAEDFLIQANFQKLNSFKSFKCDIHDRFFEINLYQKDPINKHHWRANLARPTSNIDI